MQEILDLILFSLGGQEFNLGQVFAAALAFSIILLSYRMFIKQFFPKILLSTQISDAEKNRLKKILLAVLLSIVAFVIVAIFKLDRTIYSNPNFTLKIQLVIKAILFFQIARLLDWLISHLFIHRYYSNRDNETNKPRLYNQDSESSAKKTLQYIFYLIVGLFILRSFQLDLTIYERLIKDVTVSFKISNILVAGLILLFANLFVWVLVQLVLYNIYKKKGIDQGSQFAINQLVKYIVYIFAFVFALDSMGINMSIMLGGAAALLVGVGLGLQQTFNDFISGIVLLFERTVSVGDIVVFDNTVGTIKRIGLRASIVERIDNVSLIVPNHLLVNEKVLNWSHFSNRVRFKIGVGVAYGSDTGLVKKLLFEAVSEHPRTLDYPKPIVRMEQFADSSLNFSVYFYSMDFLDIENVKSDIRLNIDAKFRASKVIIPFPQRDVNLKKD